MTDNKHTKNDLKIMQSWSLEQKIMVTQAKALEFGIHFDNKMYVLSISFIFITFQFYVCMPHMNHESHSFERKTLCICECIHNLLRKYY